MSSRLRIIVAGLVARHPVGGPAWDYLQYVLGLARLGHDVIYHEDTWCWPYDPVACTYTDDPSYSARFLARFFAEHAPELADRWHYRHLHGVSLGMSETRFSEMAGSADVFLNVSGASFLPETLSPSCVTVFVDTDPCYNQIVLASRPAWSDNVDRWHDLVLGHDRHVTYGERIGLGAAIPTLGIDWRPTRMPVVVDKWTPPDGLRDSSGRPWTTVLTWSAFPGQLRHEGVLYHDKAHEMERLIDLPGRVRAPLLIAVGGVGAPLSRLAEAGWQVVDGPDATADAGSYRDFLWRSRGEISPAKHVYAATGSGWLSCRSACYLAAGRPVVVQDTGADVPHDADGLRFFRTPEEAVEHLDAIESRYEVHAAGARELASELFGFERVLPALLEEVLS
jgi:hypothetical protein